MREKCNSFENVSFYRKTRASLLTVLGFVQFSFYVLRTTFALPEHLDQTDLDPLASASLVLGL